jgi:acetyl esterase/lipase
MALRIMTALSAAIAAAVLTMAFYMIDPIDWDGFGKFGTAALAFPLHVLVVVLPAALSAWFLKRRGARIAAALFVLVALCGTAMAVVPSVLLWKRARAWGVRLSLSEYWANAASLNIGSPVPERSVVYATSEDGSRLSLDVWRADDSRGAALHPAMLFVHGGAWIHGTRSGAPAWDVWLNRLGYDVFDVEYRLPPPARWRDEVADVKCALGWVAAHAADYRVDPARISVMGYSAGANLAMLAAYSAGDPELPPSCPVSAVAVRAVVNLYGPSELTIGYDVGGSIDYGRKALDRYVGGSPRQFAERYRLISPLNHVGATTPPTITFLGQSDRIVAPGQAAMLHDALERAGVAEETYFMPACDHGFDVNWGSWGAQIARAKIAHFLLTHDPADANP